MRAAIERQREDMVAFHDNLQAWLRGAFTGEETPGSLAAGITIASLLEVARQALVKE